MKYNIERGRERGKREWRSKGGWQGEREGEREREEEREISNIVTFQSQESICQTLKGRTLNYKNVKSITSMYFYFNSHSNSCLEQTLYLWIYG